MSASNRLIVAILIVAAAAIAFWMLLLAPKREEADDLGAQVEAAELSLSESRAALIKAEAAKRAFPADYRQLVVLGQAVPESEETSSLLVELDRVAARTELDFDRIMLTGSGETAAPVTAAPPETAPPPEGGGESGAVPAAATVPPTEAAASILPLGATIGAAGLGVMPYSLAFRGDFFDVADFIADIDGMVHTGDGRVAVDGRLITLDGFSLSPDPVLDFPHLLANFVVTTYVTPPAGVTAGATATEPPPAAPEATAPTEGGEAESSPVASAK